MPWVRLANGMTAHVRLSGQRKPKSCQCGWLGEFLCDWRVAGSRKTCDEPLCDRCAAAIGNERHLCRPHRKLFNQGVAEDGQPTLFQEDHA